MMAKQYDANYGNFFAGLYEEIRREAFGEDLGQNSWLTAGEQNSYLTWLNLSSKSKLLDIACGAGGPTLRIAALVNCEVTGVDIHHQAIETARALAAQRGLGGRANFCCVDAGGKLPFGPESFDAITCIDAINHLPERERVLVEWCRLLKRDGRVVYTNATVVTGPLTNAEISQRSSSSFYLYVPPGFDERMIQQAGLRLIHCEDRTANTAEIAERRRKAREARSSALRQIEGDAEYENQQGFLRMAAKLAEQRRLSRFLYVAERI